VHHSIDDKLYKPESSREMNPFLSDITHINMSLITIKVRYLLCISKIALLIFNNDSKSCGKQIGKHLSNIRVWRAKQHLLEHMLLFSDPFDEPDTRQGMG